MEKKSKKEVNSASIIVIIILVAIVSSIISIVVYRQTLNIKGEEHLVNSLRQDMENLQDENNVVGDNNQNNNMDNATVDNNYNDNIDSAIVEQPITLNDKTINVTVNSSFVEWEYELEALFRQRIDITIDSKEVDSIETVSWTQAGTLNYQIPEIRLITDAEDTEKEYIMILIDSFTPSSGTTSIYFYDDEGNKINEISDWGATGVVLRENNTEIPSHQLFNDSVRIIEPLQDGGARMHEYTIVNGEMRDEIIEEYSAEEVEQAGAAF